MTGGAGFVGMHLCQALLDAGTKVTILDDLSTSRPDARDTLLRMGDRLTLIEHDICDPFPVAGDLLFDLACPASRGDYRRNPLQTWKTFVIGDLHLGERAAAQGMTFGQALRGAAPTVYGDGSQTRALCYVEDIVRGMIALGITPGALGETVNLGNPLEITFRELVRLVVELTGRDVRIDLHPLPQYDLQPRCPDITRAANLLGRSSNVALRCGPARVIGDIAARRAGNEAENEAVSAV